MSEAEINPAVESPSIPSGYTCLDVMGGSQTCTLGISQDSFSNKTKAAMGLKMKRDEKLNLQVRKNYELIKQNLESDLQRVYSWRSGHFNPGPVLKYFIDPIISDVTNSPILRQFEQIATYIDTAIKIVEDVEKLLDWFDKDFQEKLTDLASVLGALFGLGDLLGGGESIIETLIRKVVPINARVEFGTGIPVLDNMIEEFISGVLGDFFGLDQGLPLSVEGLIMLLGSAEIAPGKSFLPSAIRTPIRIPTPPTDSITNIFNDLSSGIETLFGIDSITQQIQQGLKSIPGVSLITKILLEDYYAKPMVKVRVNALRFDTTTPLSKLAILLTNNGVELAGLVAQSVSDLYETGSMIYFLSALVPVVEGIYQLQLISFISFLTGSPDLAATLMNYVYIEEGLVCESLLTDLMSLNIDDYQSFRNQLSQILGIEPDIDYLQWTVDPMAVVEFLKESKGYNAAYYLATKNLISFFTEVIFIESRIEVGRMPKLSKTLSSLVMSAFPISSFFDL